jgi:hypothetical protein
MNGADPLAVQLGDQELLGTIEGCWLMVSACFCNFFSDWWFLC